MRMFNKAASADTAIVEFRKYCPYLSKTAEFSDIEIDIDNAEFMLEGLVGTSVVDVAYTFYTGDYELGTVPEDASEKIKYYLVQRVQHALAYIAYSEYVINRDVSHAETGRKSVVDAKNERQAWEFMIARDDNGIIKKMHLAINRLLQYLESNSVTDESGASAYSNPYNVVLNTLELFQRFYPIDDSRLLFFKILPFQQSEQNRHILPIVGSDRLESLVESISGGDTDTDEETLLDYIGPALAIRTIATSLKRLSVKLLPEGLVQQFNSSIQSRSASAPVKGREKDYIIESLLADAEKLEVDLANYIAKQEDGDDYDATAYDVSEDINSSDNKFFTT